MTIQAFDLFCGAGGSSCGARMADVQPMGGVDLWDKAVETYEANFHNAHVFRRTLKRQSSAKAIANNVDNIQLLIASPECTNHSVAKGSAPRCEESKSTAFQVIKFAKEMQPRWVVVENVVSMTRWSEYDRWLTELKKLYNDNVLGLRLNAEDYGVPQSRRRLFVIADRERPPVAPRPRRTTKIPVSKVLDKGKARTKYNYDMRPLFNAGRAQPTIERAERAIDAIKKREPFLIVYYGSDAAGGWQRLNRPLRTITTLDRFALVKFNHKERSTKCECSSLRNLRPRWGFLTITAGQNSHDVNTSS